MDEKELSGHDKQASVTALRVVEYFPVSQLLHASLETPFFSVPAAHGSHVPAFCPE
jgi:hypothetical protein